MYRFLTLLSLLGVALGTASSATLTTYDDSTKAQFATAVLPGSTVFTFDDLLTTGTFKDLGTGFTEPGVQFTAVNPVSYSLIAVVGTDFYDWGTGTILGLPNSDGAFLQITLNSAVTAIGLNAMQITCPSGCVKSSGTVIVSVSMSTDPLNLVTSAAQVTTSSSYPVWMGYTSDTAFDTITIQVGAGVNTRMFIDNLQLGNILGGATGGGDPDPGAPTAEITTFLMIASGLFAMRYAGRKLNFHGNCA